MILLDSQVLLWRLDDSAGMLSPAVQDTLDDPDIPVMVSAASLWELAIKAGEQKLSLPADFQAAIAAAGIAVLPVEAAHALAVVALPDIHADPFDRMLVAQARIERLTLMTRDAKLAQYGVPIQLV